MPGKNFKGEIMAMPHESQVLRTFENGLLEISSRIVPLSSDGLDVMSTSALAVASREVAKGDDAAADYTWTSRLVAVISDGSAVLGLGDLGPRAVLPVLEAKCAHLKATAGINAIPLVFSDRRIESIADALAALRPSFGAVSIEDVSSPRCFALEQLLQQRLDCPVMHNDQHGTAVAVAAALRNAAAVLGRDFASLRVVVVGAGAAGISTACLLVKSGIADVTVVDTRGVVHSERTDLNKPKREISLRTNPRKIVGSLADALVGAEVIIGLSSGRIAMEMISLMSSDPIIFSLANPDPEIGPEVGRSLAAIYGSGRSDEKNWITNLLAVPGIFKGMLSARARRMTDAMLLSAVDGIVRATGECLSPNRIVPSALDPDTCRIVSAHVALAAGCGR
ncbi:NADP-dependent malic enzyme [Kitasatospora sp. NPDC056138]|uniref:NAD(P)-dependent malic enzyme n=1 Tax=Kitasatospora sp. NPDC056138 TaxID=3345724 RepID=UPI0035E2C179